MTDLGEPQCAAGFPALDSDHRVDQPRPARMDAHFWQMTFGSINGFLSNIARILLEPLSLLA
jgi:hypothetical protein